MRLGVLELVALSALLFATGVYTNSPSRRRSSMVQAWLEQAALEPHPVPQSQADPRYDYTALKFPANSSVDALAAQYAERTGWEDVGRLGQLDAYRVFRQLKGRRLVRRQLGDGEVRLSQSKRLAKRALVGGAGFGDRERASNDTAWRDITDPLFPTQWHLVNTKEIGHDINVTGVWHQGKPSHI